MEFICVTDKIMILRPPYEFLANPKTLEKTNHQSAKSATKSAANMTTSKRVKKNWERVQ